MKFLSFRRKASITPAAKGLAAEVKHLVALGSAHADDVTRVLADADEADSKAAIRAVLADAESLVSRSWNGAVSGLASPRLRPLVASGETALLAAEAFVNLRSKVAQWPFDQVAETLGVILVTAVRDSPDTDLEIVVDALLTVAADLNTIGQRRVGNLLLPPPPPPRFLIEAVGALQLRDSVLAWALVKKLSDGTSSLAHVFRRLSALQGGLTAVGAESDAALQVVKLAGELKGPAPSAAWLRRWEDIRTSAGPGLRDALMELALNGDVSPELTYEGSGTDIPKAAIFALASWDDLETRALFRRAILNWAGSGVGSPAVGAAAIWALASFGDRNAIVSMLDVRRRIRHKSLIKRLDQQIGRLSAELGLTPDQIADESVDDCGLDAEGKRHWTLGEYQVTLRLETDGRIVRDTSGPGGKPVRDLPTPVRKASPATWTEITAAGKLLREIVGAQRQRLESAMVDGRVWSLERWNNVFRGHPVLWNLARRLVWEAVAPTGRVLVLPVAGGWSGDGIDAVASGSELRIVHTVGLAPAEQAYWQRRVVAERLVQPFKQVYRETYFATPAELAEEDRSHRFSGHVIPSSMMYALARGRGWTGTMGLGGFDGAGQGIREFPSWNVRGRLEQDWAGDDDFSTIAEVYFERLDAPGEWERVPIIEVPPIPFSETMRDIDLIVAVASIGTDQQWIEWEAQREAGRVDWNDQRRAYSSLAAAGSSVRGRMLEELLPIMQVADRVRVDGHFVQVRGKLSDYRIHLGSGNIHMEPSGSYLCIVPEHSKEQRDLYLPFEDPDLTSAEIVSKVMLLLRDDLIADPLIKGQIMRGRA